MIAKKCMQRTPTGSQRRRIFVIRGLVKGGRHLQRSLARAANDCEAMQNAKSVFGRNQYCEPQFPNSATAGNPTPINPRAAARPQNVSDGGSKSHIPAAILRVRKFPRIRKNSRPKTRRAFPYAVPNLPITLTFPRGGSDANTRM